MRTGGIPFLSPAALEPVHGVSERDYANIAFYAERHSARRQMACCSRFAEGSAFALPAVAGKRIRHVANFTIRK